jgi:hypothetical protein
VIHSQSKNKSNEFLSHDCEDDSVLSESLEVTKVSKKGLGDVGNWILADLNRSIAPGKSKTFLIRSPHTQLHLNQGQIR